MNDIFSYDVMPYPSKFFLQTHPDRLATLATFFGMNPAPVETCRVLELGCGNGSNLVSHAYNLPRAEFVGIDLAEGHIQSARAAAEELDLRNVEFRRMDVMEMTVEEFGRFDYIIAHGLFSWVPDFVRAKVLELNAQMLAEGGVGYISYNVFPGAFMRQMTQSMMRHHARHFNDPMEKVGKAVSFLAFLCENTTEKEVYAPLLHAELKRHFQHEPADIFHDDLSDLNRPFYFSEFAGLLRENELQFLAEAELHAMGTQNLSPDARKFIESIDDAVDREQYLDFLRGRSFRQTLVCRGDVTIDRRPEPGILNKFLLASSVYPASEKPELASSKVEKFVGQKGVGIEIDHPLTKAALFHLGRLWGRAVAFPELLQMARESIENQGYTTADWDEQFFMAGAIMMQICRGTGLVELHLFQPDAAIEPGEKPKINDLARWQLPQAKNVTTLLNLDIKIEDVVSRHLLELLDGTRSRADLFEEMSRFVESCDEIDDKQQLLGSLQTWVDQSVSQLARLGMFEGK